MLCFVVIFVGVFLRRKLSVLFHQRRLIL